MIEIDQEHPEYAARKATWKKYRDLYVGGDQLKSNAAEYLIRRQKEPAEVYGERLHRVFYENYAGSIVDWYAATLFRTEPALTFIGPNEPGKRFFAELVEDTDRKGTSLADFFRAQFTEALIAGISYALVDFPRAGDPVGTRGEEDQAGISRAYLVPYRADEVINWSLDDSGNYECCLLYTSPSPRD